MSNVNVIQAGSVQLISAEDGANMAGMSAAWFKRRMRQANVTRVGKNYILSEAIAAFRKGHNTHRSIRLIAAKKQEQKRQEQPGAQLLKRLANLEGF